MDPNRLRQLLDEVRSGATPIEGALKQLENLPFADLGYARVDHHRALRQGIAEVVLGEGKTPSQIAGIAQELIRGGHNVLVTRLEAAPAAEVLKAVPELTYVPVARLAKFRANASRIEGIPPVVVLTAGTTDIPVAEEAAETLGLCGLEVDRSYDVGVAGVHRLTRDLEKFKAASALIVVAGMEGALASVVGGMVAVPIIAVPTSVGYGVSLGGFTALFGMLSSCASGITVVNIDNGFGAAMAAIRIALSRGRPGAP